MSVDLGIGEHGLDDFFSIEGLVFASSGLAVDDLDVDGFGIGGDTFHGGEVWFLFAICAAHNKI